MANVLVTCGLSDSKLNDKLAGLISSSLVDRVILVRKKPLQGEKITNINPSAWIASSAFFYEVWRFFCVLFYGRRLRAQLFIGIQAQMHGLVAVLAAVLLGEKSAVWLIGSDLFIYSRDTFFAPLIRYSIRRSDTVFVMGEYSRQLVQQICGRAYRVFVQQVVCHNDMSDRIKPVEKKWDLLFAGNFVGVKNPLAAVSLFSRIHESIPSSRLCMIGDGKLMSEVLSDIERRGLGPYVDLPGHVSNPDFYIGASRVLVIPSKSEGLPSVLVEAAKLGIPVVASSVGEITGLSEDCCGITGVNPEDIDAFVAPCLKLLSDEGAYAQASDSIFQFGVRHCEMWSVDNQRSVWEKAIIV